MQTAQSVMDAMTAARSKSKKKTSVQVSALAFALTIANRDRECAFEIAERDRD